MPRVLVPLAAVAWISLLPSVHAITITEIMYHPAAADEAALGGRNLEWIELYNEDPTVVHLSGYHFSDGIDFVFPANVWLDGGQYLVVCADEEAVRAHYGITNTIGDFHLQLDNDGETVALSIYGGGPEVEFRYSDRGQWPHAADGTGHSLALKSPYLDPSDNDSWVRSRLLGGTPGAPNDEDPEQSETVLVPRGATWKYDDSGNDLGSAWYGPEFVDSAWKAGEAQLGYGDGDERTTIYYGPDGSQKYITYYFRHQFDLEPGVLFDSLQLQLLRDDGAAVYLNGQEVARDNLPEGPITATTLAPTATTSGNESTFFPFSVPPSALRAGTNTIAVEVHQTARTSSDVSFDLELAGTVTRQAEPLVINEFRPSDSGEGWLEIFNRSAVPFDAEGYFLSDDRDNLAKWPIPPGTTIPGQGVRAFSESETGLSFQGPVRTFYITRPDLALVVDGELFEAPVGDDAPLDFTYARAPDGSGRFSISTTPTQDAPNAVEVTTDIVIHEIMYHPPDGRDDTEFVELYNRGSDAVDVGGFRFNRGITFTLPPGTVMGPDKYLVVGLDPERLIEEYGLDPSIVVGPVDEEARALFGRLRDEGERLRLVDRLGNIVDDVDFRDGGSWPRWADGGGSSLELVDPWQDNAVASAWEASDESGKSAWEEISYSVGYSRQDESEFQIRMLDGAEVLVDDIRLVRDSTDYIPNGTFESGTASWIIEGNHIQSHRTTEDSFEGSASLKIVATGDGDLRVNRIECETSPYMTNGTYSVSLALRWLRGGNLVYLSGFRQTMQHTHWITLPAALGTPGAPNSRAVGNLGPVIHGAMHTPAVPPGGAQAHVTVLVSDSDGVDSVSARFRTGSPAGSFAATALLDDGGHGDGAPGDGLYGGYLPSQSSNVKVVYYIEAADTLGNTRTYPREAPNRTLVFQQGSPMAPRAAFAYRVIHDDDTWSELNARQTHSNELLDATFVFNDTEVYYNVGTRYRGSPWNRPRNPRMYRVRFPRDNRYRGRSAINLSRYGNAQRERAAYYSVWRNSTPTSTSPKCRAAFARVRTTAGEWTMEHIEPVNRDFLRLWFPNDDDGIVMKILGKLVFDDSDPANHIGTQWANFSNRGASKAAYRWNFSHRTREIDDSFAELVALVQHMNTSTTTLDRTLEDVMDVEQFLRVYAARCAHDDWDCIGIGNGQNAYVYYAPVEGRWKFLPWDMDHSWGNANARIYPDAEGAMARIMLRPKFRRMYLSILNEMLNGKGGYPGHWSTSELVDKFLDRNSARVGSDGVGGSGTIRQFIVDRRSQLQAQIPSRRTFRITTNSGNDFTTGSTATTIAGVGWIDVETVIVNDEAMELAWLSTTSWSTVVELPEVRNELRFYALDRFGSLVGSDQITVTSTVGWIAPAVSGVSPAAARSGAVITVQGTDFHDGIEVFFGSTASPLVAFSEAAKPGELTAEVPLLRPGTYDLTVRNIDQRASEAVGFEVLPLPPAFIRGDVNLDEVVDVSDPVRLLFHLFAGVEITCEDAGDADNNELLEVTDAVVVLDHLFRLASPPPAPYPAYGADPDAEGPLGCDEGVDQYD